MATFGNFSNRQHRSELIDAYEQMIEDLVAEGREPYYGNLMFNQIRGSGTLKKGVMTSEVHRVHSILTMQMVRKDKSEYYQHLRPIFIGCHDQRVWKKQKTNSRLVLPNQGYHFNFIALVPPIYKPELSGLQRQSRLKIDLVEHFIIRERFYINEIMYRVHITRVTEGTMTDYTLKTFKNGLVDNDDILILK